MLATKTTVWERLWRLVFPVDCCGCGAEGDWLCRQCLSELEVLAANRCAICKKAGRDGICERCRAVTRLDGIVAPLPYQSESVRELIAQFKYRGGFDVARFASENLGRLYLRRIPDEAWSAVFVPQSRERSQLRGYNQAEQLCRSLFGPEQILNLARKTRETVAQATLGKTERAKNIRGAFSLVPSRRVPENILICDDVVTTGATAGELARILRRKGARRVWLLALAHG